ncbi:MAG: class I SAM-dependent methyltransferase [Clostridium sp.]|nr:class I SAM-dependent methyltransferase [Clostridium sp.]MCM1398273.1 class I SAM-dependent methyltransferase [Clostridium sp.]MCM1459063.1 class I SAM-dependent methyltransferase [Bacteroides sp.]
MSEAYSDFALVYDRLMDNIPYDDWFHYIHGLLTEYGITDGIAAELGCGTGNITERLAKAGYDMIGIDNSLSMLDVARSKKTDASSSLYLCQDMREFELYGTVSAIISVCDSINYILEPDDLLDVFSLVNNYLDPKGIFIFDFNTRHYYLDVVADATIAEDREDISFIWDNYYDTDADINELALSLFIRETDDDTLFRKYEELHLQRGYTLDEITKLVQKSGLELICSYDAFTHNPATNDSERIYVIAREHGK